LREKVSEQLAPAHQTVAELAPTGEKVANLWIREVDASRPSNKVEEKLVALAKRVCLYAMETEWIRKDQDEPLQTVAGLCAERDSTWQECADTHRQINDLLGEVEKERELKIEAENVSVGLAVQVGQHRARVHALEAEAS
jgi:hypothetical protein